MKVELCRYELHLCCIVSFPVERREGEGWREGGREEERKNRNEGGEGKATWMDMKRGGRMNEEEGARRKKRDGREESTTMEEGAKRGER